MARCAIAYFLAIAVAMIAGAGPRDGQAQNVTPDPHLIADLSERFISITLGFKGVDLLLFGATDGAGEVVIVVRGPTSDVTVRRKDKIGGIWINRDNAVFTDVPGFYLVSSTAPIDLIMPRAERVERQVGFDTLRFGTSSEISSDAREDFREALIRNKQRQGLYRESTGDVQFQAGRLFRTNIVFPSNVPTGEYIVDVILIRANQVVGATTTLIEVDRRGFEALVFLFAHQRPAAYGLIAIVIALVAGWFAGFVFRKF